MHDHECICAKRDITAEKLERLDGIIEEYRSVPGSLITVLHRAQELFGFLPKEVQLHIAKGMGVEPAEVYGVVTFYSLFSMKPKGRHTIGVCKGTACYVRGSERILERLEKELGVGAGDTTDDGEFSVKVVRCVGACGLGPVMTVDEEIYARMKPDRVPSILQKYRGTST